MNMLSSARYRRSLLIAISVGLFACHTSTPPASKPLHIAKPVTSQIVASPPPPKRDYRDLGPPVVVLQRPIASMTGAASPDGLLYASSSDTNHAVRIWDTDRHIVVADLLGKHGSTREIVWSKDGRWLMARGSRGATVWNARSGQRVALAGDSAEIVESLGLVVSWDYGTSTFRVHSLDGGKETLKRVFDKKSLDKLSVTNKRVQLTFFEGEPAVVDLEGSELPPIVVEPYKQSADAAMPEVAEYTEPRTWPRYVWHEAEKTIEVVCPNGSSAFVGKDPAARKNLEKDAAWRKKLRDELGVAERTDRTEADVLFAESTDTLAAAFADVVALVDRKTGKLISRVEIKDGEDEISLYGLAFSPAGDLLLAAGYSAKKVWLVDTKTGKVRHTLNHGHYIQQYSFHPKQAMLVTASRMPVGGAYLEDPASDVRVWNTRNGLLLKTLPGSGASFSSDERMLATWNYSMLHIWLGPTFAPGATVSGTAMFAQFFPGGKYMLTPLVDTSAAHPGMYEFEGFEVRDARTGGVEGRIGERISDPRFGHDPSRFMALLPVSWHEVNSAPAHEVALFQIPSGKRERIVTESMLPIDDHAWMLNDRAIALWTNQMLHIERLDNGRKLFLQAIAPSEGTCTAAVFDDRGHFDGSAEGVIAFRLGDDLREAAMIQNGPKFEALRSSTVVADFLGDL